MTFPSGWGYYKSHNITGSTGAGTNYQVGIKVYKADSGTDGTEVVNGITMGKVYLPTAHVRDDFGDVRFSATVGGAALDYWMDPDYLVSGTSALFWVEVSSDLGSNQIIYVYYSNASQTTTSNGGNTFLLFDHFDDTSLAAEWAIIKAGGGAVTEPAGTAVLLDVHPNVSNDYAGIRSTTTFTNGVTFLVKRKNTSAGSPPAGYYIVMNLGAGGICGSTQQPAFKSGYHWRQYELNNGTGTNGIYEYNAAGTETADAVNATINNDIGNYHIYEARYDENGNIRFLVDGTSKLYKAAETTFLTDVKTFGVTQGSYSGGNYGQDTLVDYIIARKFITTEPAHSTWGTETATLITITVTSNIDVLFKKLGITKIDSIDVLLKKLDITARWLSGWTYRAFHQINPATDAGTNYQKRLVATFAAGSWENIRFANEIATITAPAGTQIISGQTATYWDGINLHVWFGSSDDGTSDKDKIYYTKSAPPFTSWSTPVCVIDLTGSGVGVRDPTVYIEGSNIYLFLQGYTTSGSISGPIKLYKITKSSNFILTVSYTYVGDPVTVGADHSYDEMSTTSPCIMKDGSTYYMMYECNDENGVYSIGRATTADIESCPWSKDGQLDDSNGDPIVNPYANTEALIPCVFYDTTHMYIHIARPSAGKLSLRGITGDFVGNSVALETYDLDPQIDGYYNHNALSSTAIDIIGFRDRTVYLLGAWSTATYGLRVYIDYDCFSCNAHSQTDFDDIRFTKGDGITLIDYWLEQKTNSDYAIFWVEIPDSLETNPANMYVYYGNSSAISLSDPAAVSFWGLGDNFNDNITDAKWTKGKTATGVVTEANNQLEISALANGDEAWYVSTDAVDTSGCVIRIKTINLQNLGQMGLWIIPIKYTNVDLYSQSEWYRVLLYGDGNIYIQSKTGGTLYSGAYLATTDVFIIKIVDGHIYFYEQNSSYPWLVYLRADEAYSLSNSTAYIYLEGRCDNGAKLGPEAHEDFFSRKMITTEPAQGAWEDEEPINSFLIDVLLEKLALTKTYPTDVLFKKEAITKTDLIDVLFKKLGITKTYPIDVNIASRLTSTDSIDVLFKQMGLKATDSIDVLFKALSVPITKSIDVIFKSLGVKKIDTIDVLLKMLAIPVTASIDTLFKSLAIPKPYSIDVRIASRLVSTDDIDVLFKKLGFVITDSVDVLFKKLGITKTEQIDVILSKYAVTITDSIDILFKKQDLTVTDSIDVLFKKLEITKTDLIDVRIASRLTSENSIDILLQKLRLTKTDSVDVLFKKLGITNEILIDIILSRYATTQEYSIDTLFKRMGITLMDSIDVLFKKLEVTKIYLIDVFTAFRLAKTDSIDALFQKLGLTTTDLIDILLASKLITTASIDVLLEKLGLVVTDSVDVLLEKLGLTRTYDIDVLIKNLGVTKTYLADLIMKKLEIPIPYYLDVLFKKNEIVNSYLIDVIFKSGAIQEYIIDALIAKLRVTKDTSIDVLLMKLAFSETYDIDTIFKKLGISLPIIVDTIIKRQKYLSYSTDVLEKQLGLIKPYSIDALLSKLELGSYNIDAVLKRLNVPISYVISVILAAVVTTNYGIDIVLYKQLGPKQVGYFLDVILVAAKIISIGGGHPVEMDRRIPEGIVKYIERNFNFKVIALKVISVRYQQKILTKELQIARKSESKKSVSELKIAEKSSHSNRTAELDVAKEYSKSTSLNELAVVKENLQSISLTELAVVKEQPYSFILAELQLSKEQIAVFRIDPLSILSKREMAFASAGLDIASKNTLSILIEALSTRKKKMTKRELMELFDDLNELD